MMDPFASAMHNQHSRQRSNQMAIRNNDMDNFMMSPFDHHNAIMSHHRNAMHNPFALMNQMMGGFGRNMFENLVNLFQSYKHFKK